MMFCLFAFLAGCCLGSFINVVFSRKDWYKGRSRCDFCGYILKWYDMIPIISFIFLQGKCRHCKERIGLSHIISEMFMGTAFACGANMIITHGLGYGIVSLVALFFIALAAIEDYREQMVYSWILNGGVIATLIAAIAYLLSAGEKTQVIILIVSVFFLKGFLFMLSRIIKDKIGEGDFDILIVILIMSGIIGLIYSLTFACFIGCLLYLPPIILKKRDRHTPLPFVPLLYVGSICFLML